MALMQGTIVILFTAVLTVFGLRAVFQNRTQTALLLVLALALVLRVFMAGDLYLHDWDERFHANIAKNIFSNPIVPVLYDDDVLVYEPNNWAEGKTWLSKPLLTFWPLGASIGLFGANEFGLRLPSLIFGLLGVWLTFLTGRRLFDNRVGLVAAFLHAIHGMLLRFGGGITSSDHVDQLFTLLFAWCIYAYVRYYERRERRFLLLAGVVIGLAFLTKWIMALFAGLILAAVHLFVVKKSKDYVLDGLLILTGAVVIASPWVIYLFLHYPVEVKLVFGDFLARTDGVFEGHSGGPFFYLEQLISQFRGILVIPMVWLALVAFQKQRFPQLLLTAWIFLPFLLLSGLTTKRGTYLMMSAPAYFMLTGYFLRWLLSAYRSTANGWLATGACILFLGLPLQYTLEQVKPFRQRFTVPEWRLDLERQITWHERLGERMVIHDYPHALDAMFYCDILAYQRKLHPEEIRKFEAKGYKVISMNTKN